MAEIQVQIPTRDPQATDLQIIQYALDCGIITQKEIRKVALQILGLSPDPQDQDQDQFQEVV